jgi:hypothetical protein
MQGSELVISVLGCSSKPIDGRTAIQKIVYFASIKTRVDLSHKPHFYGPYAPTVAGLLESLVSMGYIAEESRLTAHDRTMYSYSIAGDGRRLVEETRKRESANYAKIKFVVDLCWKIARNNIYVLSWAAKVYFLLKQRGEKISDTQAIEMGKQFGWKLSTSQIESGVKLLQALGLATRTKSN